MSDAFEKRFLSLPGLEGEGGEQDRQPDKSEAGTTDDGGLPADQVRLRRERRRLGREQSAEEGGFGAHSADDSDQFAILPTRSERAERKQNRRAAALARKGDRREPTTGEENFPPSVARATPLPQIFDEDRIPGLPPLPQHDGRRSFATYLSFVLCVIVPTLLASTYYIFIASNQYVSEFRFAVRELSQPSTVSTGSADSMASLLGATSMASNSAENYMVTEYLTSRQVLDELQEKINIRQLYSRPRIDWWARFDPTLPMEKFVSYWQDMVTANFDQITGVAVARVRAFTPDDAHLIATTMVALAENLVNEISMRPRLDAVKFAEREVKRAEDRLRKIRAEISAYRDKESVIEPNSSVVTSNTTLAQSLRASLTQYQTELGALTLQNLRPDSPYMVNLKSRIESARAQLAAVEAQIATSKEGNPLSRVVGQYEQLDLERQFAQTILTGAVQSLERARANAISQQLYVTPFVRPARPESSTYPNRIVSILTVTLACFFIWTIGLLVVRSIREHLA